MKKFLVIIIIICSIQSNAQELDGKFVPTNNKQLLIIGQDLGAIGGFEEPNNSGYIENVSTDVSGVTFYTSLPSLAGLKTKTNWGGGDVCGQCIAENPKYRNTVLSIGLYMVDQLDNINSGSIDNKIAELGIWIKQRKKPVFLRVGYEFDGAWNHYDPKAFIQSWKRIKSIFDSLKVENCALVWQACTSPIDELIDKKHEDISEWYPGDEYVDWMGFSWFLNDSIQYQLTNELLDFARKHNKPVMVAESAPQGYDLKNKTKRNIGEIYDGKSGLGLEKKKSEEIWNEWFIPFFDYIKSNKDIIRAVAYINCNWDEQGLWGAPYNQGYWGDTRIGVDKNIRSKWLSEISEENWLKGGKELFLDLNYVVEKATNTKSEYRR